MNCSDVKLWLDSGMPPEARPAARTHAEHCPGCAASLRAAMDIEALLGSETPPAPAGFAERVMAQVEAAGRSAAPVNVRPAPAGGGPALPPLPTMPWWVQAIADRATALAIVLAGLLVWKIDWLGAAVQVLAGGAYTPAVYDALASAEARIGLDAPAAQLCLWLMLLAAIAWGSLALYRWTERFLSRRVRA